MLSSIAKYLSVALLLITIVYTIDACKKKKQSFWFTGMEVVDSNGKEIKWVGSQDDDWQQNKYSLTTQQTNLLDLEVGTFPNWGQTMVNLVNVAPGTNPIGIDTNATTYYGFTATADSACVVTYTLADQQMNTLAKGNAFIPGGATINIPIAIPTSYLKAGSVYRLYYGFSAQLNKFFSTGWGDIGVCNKTNGKTGSCF